MNPKPDARAQIDYKTSLGVLIIGPNYAVRFRTTNKSQGPVCLLSGSVFRRFVFPACPVASFAREALDPTTSEPLRVQFQYGTVYSDTCKDYFNTRIVVASQWRMA